MNLDKNPDFDRSDANTDDLRQLRITEIVDLMKQERAPRDHELEDRLWRVFSEQLRALLVDHMKFQMHECPGFDAEDFVQQFLTNPWDKVQKFESGSARKWLRTCMKNAKRNYLRHQRVKQEHAAEVTYWSEKKENETLDFMNRTLLRFIVQELIDAEEATVAVIITRKFFHGEELKNIAADLGLSQTKVSRIHLRFLTRSKQYLEPFRDYLEF